MAETAKGHRRRHSDDEEGKIPPGMIDEAELRWLISYSDYMMQLVVLFLLLFAVSEMDKAKMVAVGKEIRAHFGIEEGDAIGSGKEPYPGEGVPAKFAKVPEGTLYTIGGSSPFDLGLYILKQEHYKLLELVHSSVAERANRIIIRGYTSRDPEDSVVPDGNGGYRKWTPQDPEEEADWRMLGFLRAREAEEYLKMLKPPINPGRIILQSEGAWGDRHSSGARDDGEEAKDRRVDVIVIPEVAGN